MPLSDVRSSKTSAPNARGKYFQKFTCSNFLSFGFRGSYFRVLVVGCENRENLDLSKISHYTVTPTYLQHTFSIPSVYLQHTFSIPQYTLVYCSLYTLLYSWISWYTLGNFCSGPWAGTRVETCSHAMIGREDRVLFLRTSRK